MHRRLSFSFSPVSCNRSPRFSEGQIEQVVSVVTSFPIFMAASALSQRETTSAPAPLLPRVAAGDDAAIKECLSRYGRLVHSLAYRYLGRDGDLDDACQDIFVALWKSAASFDAARGSEVTFVALIARRRLIDRGRAAGTRALPVVEEGAPSSGSALENYVDAKVALAALSQCSDEQQRVIALAAFQGLTQSEIAEELQIPLGTVKSHYARGIERVKRALRMNEATR